MTSQPKPDPSPSQPWFEDDTLWADMALSIFDAKQMGAAALEVEQVVALMGLAPGARVLDMPCGIGRHSVELARRGFAVTGVDRGAPYLARAAETARGAGVALELVKADMRTFVRTENGGAFDAAINLYTSIGYGAPEDDRAMLTNVCASLRAGGALVIDTIGREVIARNFRERDYWKDEGGMPMLEEREIIGPWQFIRSHRRWILPDGTLSREYVFEVHPYAGDELERLLREVGFDRVEIYGSLAGVTYDHLAKRLVVVGRKK